MAKVLLTNSQLYKLMKKKLEKPREYMTDLSGIEVLVRKVEGADNAISFILRTKKYGLNGRIKTIGRFPIIDIEKARAIYLQWIDELRRGELPWAAEHRGIPKVVTLGELFSEWLQLHYDVDSKSYINHSCTWNKHVSALENMDIKAITFDTIMDLFKGKTTGTQVSMLKILRPLLDYAVDKNLLTRNPAANISRHIKHEVQHVPTFSDEYLEDEMIQFFSICKKELTHHMWQRVQFLFFTLLRQNEAWGLKVGDLRPEGNIVLPTKTRAEFRVPLHPRALEILQECSIGRSDDSYIFHSPRGGSPHNRDVSAAFISMGYRNRLAPHGIRACGRQWLQINSSQKESIIEMCLSHQVSGVIAQSYNRGEYYKQREVAMLEWGSFVASCIDRADGMSMADMNSKKKHG